MPGPNAIMIVIGGTVLLAVIGFQMLVGFRKIKFKGRTHLKVHKWAAWALLGFALLHAIGGLVYVGVLPGL